MVRGDTEDRDMMVLMMMKMMKNDEDYDAYCCLLKRWDHRPFSLHTGTFILNFQLEYKTRKKQRGQILNFQLEH